MKSTIQNLSNSQVEIRVEVPYQELQTFMDKAASILGEDIEIEGFRKGKAPKEEIEKKVGKEKILQTAAQECIRENYIKAIQEHKLEPLGQPAVEILKLVPDNPLEFKVKIAVLPEIDLPDYKKIVSKIKRPEIKVTDEEIQKLKEEKERSEKDRLRQEMLEKIAEASKLEIPEILVDSEKNRMLGTIKEQVPQMLGISFEDYLKKMNKTEKELLDSFSSESEKRVKNSLILRGVQRKEDVNASEKEIEEEMAKIGQANPGVDKVQLKEYAESVIKNEKTFKILEDLTKS